jgi:hypothetical protein
MKFAIILLVLATALYADLGSSETQAAGFHRNHARSTYSRPTTYSYAGLGRGYSVYAAYPSWYTGVAPISRLNSGSFGGRGWYGSRAGVYLNGGNNAIWGSPR